MSITESSGIHAMVFHITLSLSLLKHIVFIFIKNFILKILINIKIIDLKIKKYQKCFNKHCSILIL